MLNWVLGKKTKGARAGKTAKGRKPAYNKAREIAASGDEEARRALAAHEDMEPEILYFFASDDSRLVRMEVAENPGTPLQADVILADDDEADVRCELARKIGRLVPQLTEDENERLIKMALQVLEVLAHDALPKVRAIIAEELKLARNVPQKIIRDLAEDLDDIVSVPVLQYSPLLSDGDLIQIIARGVKGRALIAIAARRDLAGAVVDAIVETPEADAIQTVLENKTAAIGDGAFEHIAEQAEANPEWHNAMVYRDDLPIRIIQRIASFVNAALMESLIALNTDQKDLVESLRKTVRERIERGELEFEDSGHVSARARAEQEMADGTLDEKRIDAALAAEDFAFVRYGLNLLAGLVPETSAKMLNFGSAKAMTAMAWKAGLSMEMAVKLQRQIGRLDDDKIMQPDAEGGYPMSEKDIEWYLASFFD